MVTPQHFAMASRENIHLPDREFPARAIRPGLHRTRPISARFEPVSL